MKKNKGFTLVELLAVISVIGVVVVLVLPGLLNVFNKSKHMLDDETTKALVDSGKMYATDLDLGNVQYVALENMVANGVSYAQGTKVKPYDMRVYLIEHGLNVSIKDLVKKDYFKDGKCDYDTNQAACKLPATCVIKISIDGEKIENGRYYVTNDYKATILSGCE